MIEPAVAKVITTTILAPTIKLIIQGAKQIGVSGFSKWEKSTYHAKIQRKVSSIESLKTFWSADKLVNLTDFYYPSKIELDETKKHCQLISDLPDGNLIIEGIVGQGKSIFLRHLATSEIRSNQANNFPIFIEFRTLSKKIDLELAIKNYLEEVNIDGFDDETFSYVMNSGKFILFLDAFDEIEEDLTKDAFLQIERYAELYENLRILITSRPSAEIQKSSKFKTIKLAALSETDYTPFLMKLGLSAIFTAEIKNSIKNSPSKVSQLIRTPLMLTLVVRAYRSVNEIPENLPDFFEVLFKCVFSGHDKAKPYIKRTLATKLSEKKLQELFEAFCFICIRDKITRSLSTAQFDTCFGLAQKKIDNGECESCDFREDMHKVACLILPDGFENWVFLHKSVMEYYAASFIKSSSENFAIKFYNYALRDAAPWMEVLTFLKYIDEYRFNKHYLLIELDAAIEDFNFLNSEITTVTFLSHLENLNLSLNLSLDINDTSNGVSVGVGSGRPRFCYRGEINVPLFNFIRRIAHEDLKIVDTDFLDFLKLSQSGSGRIGLDLRQATKLFGDGDLLVDYKKILARLNAKKSSAISVVELHESRCDMIED